VAPTGNARLLFPERFQAAILKWFKPHQRDMPWRRTGDAYAIWVSEIMLQQTQVATVKPYYERFLKRFPNVHALADAPLADVLKLWEGLGYYSRARNLHKAAVKIVRESGGELPRTAAGLMSLPGIGRYTAGAIASIAFGLDEPVLAGNVARVLCRLCRIREDPKTNRARERLWGWARRLMPQGKAALFNQALMDLGATICVSRNPSCQRCPVRGYCEARRRNEQDQLPVKAKAKPTPHHDIAVGIIWKRDRILIDQRKSDGLLGGLWEFPGGKREPGEALETALRREVLEEVGIRIRVLRQIGRVKHAYSHFRITLYAFECRHVSGRPRALGCAAWRWVRLEELDQYAFPKANHKIMAMLCGTHVRSAVRS